MLTTDHLAIVAFANDAFYSAFTSGDFTMMSTLWQQSDEVTCIHPGWAPLSGYEDVMTSWERIFSGANTPLTPHRIRTTLNAGVFNVLCYEQLPGGWLIATNSFVIADEKALLIHHQASPCEAPQDIDNPGPALQ